LCQRRRQQQQQPADQRNLTIDEKHSRTAVMVDGLTSLMRIGGENAVILEVIPQ